MKYTPSTLFLFFILFLSTSSIFAQTTEKDTLIITCLNSDSIAVTGLDTSKIYINNTTLPFFDISVGNELSCANPKTTLSVNLFGEGKQQKIEVVTPMADTINLENLSIEVSQIGLYYCLVTDLKNGCMGIKSIEVLANADFGNCEVDSAIAYLPISPNSQWRTLEESVAYPQDNNPFIYYRFDKTFTYFFSGDTILNNQAYWKMYSTTLPIVDVANGTNNYLGAFREKDQKSYFIVANNATEVLLYDFTITVGDTLVVEQFNIDYVEEVKVFLASIDTFITQDNLPRRQFNFKILYEYAPTTPQPYATWLEGVGNIGDGGFLQTHLKGIGYTSYFNTTTNESYGINFQCYSIGEKLIYQSERYDNCYINQFREYAPFPIRNAVWRTLESEFNKISQTRTYFTDGDTLINNHSYTKIYTTQNKNLPTIPSKDQYYGALRQDKKVIYFLEKGQETAHVLYDFNLAVGDTVTTYLDDTSTEIIIFVNEIDTVQLLDGQFRKRFRLAAKANTEGVTDLGRPYSDWIEGIGDVQQGFLSFNKWDNTFNRSDEFQCFQFYNQTLYQNKNLESCYLGPPTPTIPYPPFVVENATWIQASNTDVYAETRDYYGYKIKGDSTINGIAYKKLFYYNLKELGGGKYELISSNFSLLMREDLSERKVYGYPTINNYGDTLLSEYLLADFSKGLGDTISYYDISIGDYIKTVVEQESVAFQFGADRRILFLKNNILLIEGLGFFSGLIEAPQPVGTPVGGRAIIAYCQGLDFTCNILSATNDPLPQKVDIFPNPTKNFLSLQFEQIFDGQIQLHSLAGQVVYQTEIQSTNHEITVSDLPKGLYFLHLQAEEGYLIQKIVIQ